MKSPWRRRRDEFEDYFLAFVTSRRVLLVLAVLVLFDLAILGLLARVTGGPR